jgi:hypothetical protein
MTKVTGEMPPQFPLANIGTGARKSGGQEALSKGGWHGQGSPRVRWAWDMTGNQPVTDVPVTQPKGPPSRLWALGRYLPWVGLGAGTAEVLGNIPLPLRSVAIEYFGPNLSLRVYPAGMTGRDGATAEFVKITDGKEEVLRVPVTRLAAGVRSGQMTHDLVTFDRDELARKYDLSTLPEGALERLGITLRPGTEPADAKPIADPAVIEATAARQPRSFENLVDGQVVTYDLPEGVDPKTAPDGFHPVTGRPYWHLSRFWVPNRDLVFPVQGKGKIPGEGGKVTLSLQRLPRTVAEKQRLAELMGLARSIAERGQNVTATLQDLRWSNNSEPIPLNLPAKLDNIIRNGTDPGSEGILLNSAEAKLLAKDKHIVSLTRSLIDGGELILTKEGPGIFRLRSTRQLAGMSEPLMPSGLVARAYRNPEANQSFSMFRSIGSTTAPAPDRVTLDHIFADQNFTFEGVVYDDRYGEHVARFRTTDIFDDPLVIPYTRTHVEQTIENQEGLAQLYVGSTAGENLVELRKALAAFPQ